MLTATKLVKIETKLADLVERSKIIDAKTTLLCIDYRKAIKKGEGVKSDNIRTEIVMLFEQTLDLVYEEIPLQIEFEKMGIDLKI